MQKVLFIPDTHIPYEDKRAWKIMLAVAKDFKPNVVIILGDFLDNYAVAPHERIFPRDTSFRESLAVGNKRLDEIQAATPSATERHYIEGNHENWWTRTKLKKLPEDDRLDNDIPTALRLKERGYSWTPWLSTKRLGKLDITHGTKKTGKYAPWDLLTLFQYNIVSGHTHHLSVAYGHNHVSAIFGWLGDITQVDYMHQAEAKFNWQHGFGLGYFRDNKNVHVYPVPIINYCAIWDGKEYSA